MNKVSLVNVSLMQRVGSFFKGKPKPKPKPKLVDVGHMKAYGMMLRDIVHDYCNVHLWYGPSCKGKPDVDPNSNLAKHLNAANCIVGIFHHSNPLVIKLQHRSILVPQEWDTHGEFADHLPALLRLDIPELNARKESFAKSLDLDEGLDLVKHIMLNVFNKDIEESNLDELPQPVEVNVNDPSLKMVDATILYAAARGSEWKEYWMRDGIAIAACEDGSIWECKNLKWTHWKDFSPIGLVFTPSPENLESDLMPLSQWHAWKEFHFFQSHDGYCLGKHQINVKYTETDYD